MRGVALFLLVCTLSAGWAVRIQAQEEGKYLVGDGRLGPWRLGISEQDLLKEFSSRFGSGFRIDPPFNHRLPGAAKAYFWRTAGFQFVAYEGKVVSIAIWRRYTDPTPNAELMRYKTKEGIGIGVPLSTASVRARQRRSAQRRCNGTRWLGGLAARPPCPRVAESRLTPCGWTGGDMESPPWS
ncbi:MAG: hypothetical protein QN157_13665 [Armatimonadota bacterium]|nr:hypothetical protein [Armatimonadota bacterium]